IVSPERFRRRHLNVLANRPARTALCQMGWRSRQVYAGGGPPPASDRGRCCPRSEVPYDRERGQTSETDDFVLGTVVPVTEGQRSRHATVDFQRAGATPAVARVDRPVRRVDVKTARVI